MGKLLLLYEPRTAISLSWGAWQPTMPLANLVDERLHFVARSLSTDPDDTRVRAVLPQQETFASLVIGPGNFSSASQYRIRKYSDATFTTTDYDSGVIDLFEGTVVSLPWGHPYFWTGILPLDDNERGANIIHVFDNPVTGRYWSVEVIDPLNPAGFIEMSWLFMPSYFAPSRSYVAEGNGLGFIDNSLSASTLAGGRKVSRRVNPRRMTLVVNNLPHDEAFGDAYRFARVAGYDGRVFIIPDIADLRNMQRRSYYGRLTQADPISQALIGYGNTGYQHEEIIS